MSAQYEKWLNKSEAVFVLSYEKMTMKEIDAFRAKVRETGSEAHLVKNTLFNRALAAKGFPQSEIFEGTSLVGFAFGDVAALAKVFSEATKGSETTKVKGGFLGKEVLTSKQVKSLADLPPMPVMRAMLLGVISAPATKLVRTPGRTCSLNRSSYQSLFRKSGNRCLIGNQSNKIIYFKEYLKWLI